MAKDDVVQDDAEAGADAQADEGLDLEDRALCPDGACIGVLSTEGICKVCGCAGEPAVGAIASGGTRAGRASGRDMDDDLVGQGQGQDEDDGDEDDGDEGDGDEDGLNADADDQDDVVDPDDRELCPDGACIGVIGPDGACKECGRPRA